MSNEDIPMHYDGEPCAPDDPCRIGAPVEQPKEQFAMGALPHDGVRWQIGLTHEKIIEIGAEMDRRVETEREACAGICESASSIEVQISGLEVTMNAHDYAAEVLTACAGTIRQRGVRS